MTTLIYAMEKCMFQKVEGEPDLVRDDSGIIRNMNHNDYRAFIIKRAAALENKNRLDKIESDNKEIKQTLDLILKLLKEDRSK